MSKCFLYDVCNHKDCDKDFCLRKYKMDSLYSAALMTDTQKRHIVLRVDQDNTDLEQFKQLAAIEQDNSDCSHYKVAQLDNYLAHLHLE